MKINANVINLLVNQYADAMASQGIGIGCKVNKETTKVLEIPEDIKVFLWDKTLTCYGNNEQYFLVNDEDDVLYYGLVDKEGLENTVVHDLVDHNQLINVMISFAKRDVEQLFSAFSNEEGLMTYLAHLKSGITKGQENGHY